MKTRLLFQHGLGSLALMSSTAWAARTVSFSQSVETVEAYDYVEVTLNVDKPDARNPFLDVAVNGSFSKTDGSERDPYKHLATSHPTHREPQDRGSDWFGFT